MAADRRISSNHIYYRSPTPKIIKIKDFLVGMAGDDSYSSEIATVIEGIPDCKSLKMSVDSYIRKVFFPKIIDTLRKKGVVHREEIRINKDPGLIDRQNSRGVFMLVGVKGHVFEMGLDESDYTVSEVPLPYAIGAGGSYALGSLHTTSQLDLPAKEKLKLAIDAAAAYHWSCDSDIDYIAEK